MFAISIIKVCGVSVELRELSVRIVTEFNIRPILIGSDSIILECPGF